MAELLKEITKKYINPKNHLPIRSGDTVRVHQKIKEGNKERIQAFQGLVIRTDQTSSYLFRITVRRVASGVGVEKSFLVNSPLVDKIEILRRSKVRRNYLSYMRQRTGKAARLSSVNYEQPKVESKPVSTEEPQETTVPETDVTEKSVSTPKVDSKSKASPKTEPKA